MKQMHIIYEFTSVFETIRYFLPVLIIIGFGIFGAGLHFYNKWFVDPASPGYGKDGYPIQFSNMRTGAFIMVVSTLLTVFITASMLRSYNAVINKYKNRNYKIAIGPIKDLRDSVLRGGDTLSLFLIDTVRFELAKNDNIMQENNRKYFRNGQNMKISYFSLYQQDKEFLKIEIP